MRQADYAGCHPGCTIGPDADHHGTMSYRCVDENAEALPFPGESFTVFDMAGHPAYAFAEDDA